MTTKQQEIIQIKGLIDDEEKANGPFQDGGVIDEWIEEALSAVNQLQSSWDEFKTDMQQTAINFVHNPKSEIHFIRLWYDFLKSWGKTGDAIHKQRIQEQVCGGIMILSLYSFHYNK